MRYGYDPVWTVFLNNIIVFILPFLCGILLRLLLRKARIGWLSTVVFAVLTVITIIIAFNPSGCASVFVLRLVPCL